jgi:hypothetical protein
MLSATNAHLTRATAGSVEQLRLERLALSLVPPGVARGRLFGREQRLDSALDGFGLRRIEIDVHEGSLDTPVTRIG